MSVTTEQETFFALLRDEWEETPVAWPNREYKPTPGTPWVRAQVLPAESRQATLGPRGGATLRRFDATGLAVVQVFVPAGTGDVEARRLAALIESIYRGRTVDDTTFRAPWTDPIGSDGAWYQVNVVVPYRRASNY